MEYLEVQGVRLPVIGFGTWQVTGRAGAAMVRTALALGYRHLDTASIYGNEEEVGRGIRDSGVPPDEIFVTTKAWTSDLAPGPLTRSAEQSLRKLGLEAIDLLLIHWPSRSVPLGDTLGAMQALRERGLVRHVGVSNFPAPLLRETVERHGAEVFCNQVEYHPFLAQDEVLAYCRARGIAVVAYSPVTAAIRDPVLTRIGARHGKTAVQVALRWLIEQDMVAAIPRSTSPEHARANLEVFDFALTDEDRATIAALPKNRRLIFG